MGSLWNHSELLSDVMLEGIKTSMINFIFSIQFYLFQAFFIYINRLLENQMLKHLEMTMLEK